MTKAELLVQMTEEKQTYKILNIISECNNLEEAKEKIRALLSEYENEDFQK